jgi:hypothetical protein
MVNEEKIKIGKRREVEKESVMENWCKAEHIKRIRTEGIRK